MEIDILYHCEERYLPDSTTNEQNSVLETQKNSTGDPIQFAFTQYTADPKTDKARDPFIKLLSILKCLLP